MPPTNGNQKQQAVPKPAKPPKLKQASDHIGCGHAAAIHLCTVGRKQKNCINQAVVSTSGQKCAELSAANISNVENRQHRAYRITHSQTWMKAGLSTRWCTSPLIPYGSGGRHAETDTEQTNNTSPYNIKPAAAVRANQQSATALQHAAYKIRCRHVGQASCDLMRCDKLRSTHARSAPPPYGGATHAVAPPRPCTQFLHPGQPRLTRQLVLGHKG